MGACAQAAGALADYTAQQIKYGAAVALQAGSVVDLIAKGASAALTVANAAVNVASQAVSSSMSALASCQGALDKAAAALKTAADAVSKFPGLASGVTNFLNSIFSFVGASGSFQYSSGAATAQVSVDLKLFGQAFTITLAIGLDLNPVVRQLTDWLNSIWGKFLVGILTSGRGHRHLLQDGASASASQYVVASNVVRYEFDTIDVIVRERAATNYSANVWASHKAVVARLMAGLNNTAVDDEFLSTMTIVLPGLAELTNTTVFDYAAYETTSSSTAFNGTGAGQAQHGPRNFTLSQGEGSCADALSDVSATCSIQFATLVWACLSSSRSGDSFRCSSAWLSLSNDTSRITAMGTSCQTETSAILTDFMQCSSSCASDILTTVSPACGGGISVGLSALLSSSFDPTICTAAMHAAEGCSADMAASTLCAELFFAVPQKMRAELLAYWHQPDMADPAAAAALGLTGSVDLYDVGLTGTVSSGDLCESAARSINLGQNQIIGDLPACLVQGGYYGTVSHLDVADNYLSGELPIVGDTLVRLFISYNNLSGDAEVVFANGTALKHLYVRNNNITGTLAFIAGLPQLRHLDVSHNALSDNNISVAQHLGEHPSIASYRIGGNTFDTSLAALPLAVAATVRGVLVTAKPISEFCSACPLHTFEQDCTALPCASASVVDNLVCGVQQYLNAVVSTGAPHSFKILRLVPVGNLSVASYVVDAPPPIVDAVTAAMRDYSEYAADYACHVNVHSPALIVYVTAQPGCPPGRLGASCSYFCASGWRDYSQLPMPVVNASDLLSNEAVSMVGDICTPEQTALNDTTCLRPHPRATGFVSASPSAFDDDVHIESFNCSVDCLAHIRASTSACNEWTYGSQFDDGTAARLANCTAALEVSEKSCSPADFGHCEGKLQGSSARCGAENLQCFQAHASYYTRLMTTAFGFSAFTPWEAPTFDSITGHKSKPLASAALQTATADLLPHCQAPSTCSNQACTANLTMALSECKLFLYNETDTGRLEACVVALTAAKMACSECSSEFDTVADGVYSIVNGSAAAHFSAAPVIAFDVVGSFQLEGVEGWDVSNTMTLAAALSNKLALPEDAVKLFGAASSNLSARRRTLLEDVTPPPPPEPPSPPPPPPSPAPDKSKPQTSPH